MGKMTDQQFDVLMQKLSMGNRRKVVAALLNGNDAQCFTTRQYAEAYHRICHDDDLERKEDWLKCLTELTPIHMASVGFIEVQPDVWAKVGYDDA